MHDSDLEQHEISDYRVDFDYDDSNIEDAHAAVHNSVS